MVSGISVPYKKYSHRNINNFWSPVGDFKNVLIGMVNMRRWFEIMSCISMLTLLFNYPVCAWYIYIYIYIYHLANCSYNTKASVALHLSLDCSTYSWTVPYIYIYIYIYIRKVKGWGTISKDHNIHLHSRWQLPDYVNDHSDF